MHRARETHRILDPTGTGKPLKSFLEDPSQYRVLRWSSTDYTRPEIGEQGCFQLASEYSPPQTASMMKRGGSTRISVGLMALLDRAPC